jgi:cell division protease FtsH
MVHDYAMGTSISALRISAEGGAVSDRTRQLRDEEQQHFADEAMRSAVRLIREHRDRLEALAGALLRDEVLERAGIERIMDGVPRVTRQRGKGLRVVAVAPTPTTSLNARGATVSGAGWHSSPSRLTSVPGMSPRSTRLPSASTTPA